MAMMDLQRWRREVEPMLRAQGFAHITSQPEVLFERDGGPVGLRADIYLARLFGPEDEIVDDTVRLASAMPELLVPRPVYFSAASFDRPIRAADLDMPVDRYLLQSAWATMKLWPELAPKGSTYGRDFMVAVAFLRYRRHLEWR